MKKAIIVGSNGQDGRLLCENLSRCNYHIIGIDQSLYQSHAGETCMTLDINDYQAVADLIRTHMPDEVYYLAAFHHSSENLPLQENNKIFSQSFQVHVFALVNFLEAMKIFSKDARLFYAASSHVFGNASIEPQNEQTPFNPIGIYGITKAAGIYACRFYRNQHRLFVSTGILYNHESQYRQPLFVTTKIINGAIDIKNGFQNKLSLGNLDAEVDWGYAPDYVEAFRRILGASMPDDFIVATGKKHTVRDFVEITFSYLGLDWTKYVEEDAKIISKSGAILIGNPEKLVRITGWKPSVDLRGMIKLLLQSRGTIPGQ
ncbi:MAG TPA: GDP-mannose 4,6-dehydratase [Smithella sp.]|nr:GDP-mannose 4,6-dehydratase [Smithella sp.]HPN87270.1 GDP-mannose 4,6-dehydratase [Smithella sp.]